MTATILGVPRARPVVEVGLGTDFGASGPAGIWDVSEWDDPTSLWGRSEPYWVDVTCHTQEISTFTGRERAGDDWEVGTATVVVQNLDGWADYPPTRDLEAGAEYLLSLRPGRPLRIAVAVDGGVPFVLWRGFIDQANPEYLPDIGDTVTLECIDAKGEAGRVDVTKLAAAVGAGETVTQRINRILDALEWRPGVPWRHVATSAIPLIATQFGSNGTGLLNLAATSGGGAIWGDLGGGVTFVTQDWQVWNVDDPVDAVIGQYEPVATVDLVADPEGSYLIDPVAIGLDVTGDGTGLYAETDPDLYLIGDPVGSGLYLVAVVGPDVVCPSSWEMSFARADYPTRVVVGTAGADPRPAFTDIEAQAAFGLETLERTDLETQNNVDLDMIGARSLAIYGVHAAPRVAAVVLDAQTADNVVDVITTVDARTPSRYLCKHRRPGPGGIVEVFSRQMFATSVEHEIAPDMWTCRIGLDDASVFAVGADTGRWGPSDTAGIWDTTTWSRRAVLWPEEV